MQYIIEDDGVCRRIVYCIADRDRFDVYSYELLRETGISGLVVPQSTERNGLDAIQYDISGYDTLRNYLGFSLSVEKLLSVFSQIISIVRSLDEYLVDNSMLITDIGQIYYDREEGRVMMIYYPVFWENGQWKCEERIFSLFKEILFSAKLVVSDDDRYIAELLNGMNNAKDYSLAEFECTVSRLESDVSKKAESVESRINRYDYTDGNTTAQVCEEEAAAYCIVPEEQDDFGYGGDDIGVEKDGGIIRSFVRFLFGDGGRKKDGDGCEDTDVYADEPVFEGTMEDGDSGSAGMCGDGDEGETMVLLRGENGTHTPYLIRKSGGERVDINKRVFRIGKDKRYADYIITDNAAVSRAHAEFMIKDGKVFLTDEDSLNSTFINGDKISSGCEKEVRDGDVVMFADEEFMFHC